MNIKNLNNINTPETIKIYTDLVKEFYDANIDLLKKIQELGKEYEKFNSNYYVNSLLKSEKQIDNTFYNKFVLPNNFPDFSKYKQIYRANLPITIRDLFPYYFDYNYNIVYSKDKQIEYSTITGIQEIENVLDIQ